MKPVFLIPVVLMILSSIADAQEIFRCVDAQGITILTSTPQQGMKCSSRESDEEPRYSSKSAGANLADQCSQWSLESDDISREITDLEKRRIELQRKQIEARKNETSNRNSGYGRGNHLLNDKMYRTNKEISLLSQKRALIQQDMRLYKCHELNQDLLRLNQKEPSKNQRYPKR